MSWEAWGGVIALVLALALLTGGALVLFMALRVRQSAREVSAQAEAIVAPAKDNDAADHGAGAADPTAVGDAPAENGEPAGVLDDAPEPVSEAHREAERILTEARTEAARIVAEARDGSAAPLADVAVGAVAQDADALARETLIASMERQVGEATTDATAAWFPLPSKEMKGRIIGREGRNIRVLESLTGVTVLIDDDANGVHLSTFDLARREVASETLRILVDDGRIQPSRIEKAYAAAVAATPERDLRAGRDAARQAGVDGLSEGVLTTLGRLRLRSSMGQNVLGHSVETARLAAEIASQVGADEALARRAALLHDLGKAFTDDRAGTHAALGAAELRATGEGEPVVNAVAAHHGEVRPDTLEAVILQVADRASAGRPGARREEAEPYLDRMKALEREIGARPGVSKALVMAAGREVWVAVEPGEVADQDVPELARTIAGHIDADPRFPGEIRVTVVRELRADAVAGES